MKKRSVILASLFIILLVLPIFVCASNEKISNLAIENAFNDGKENVSVLISAAPQTNGKFKSNSVIKDKNFISKDINYTEYLDLMADKDVQIEYNFKIKTLLQQSTPLINAPTSWTLQTSGINLTGNSQSVCILDTGINYSHSDFGSCSSVGSGGSCRIIGGYDFGNNDNDPLDYDGHGTHVAGIAAANGGINGVAPTANIVAVKVFSDAGFGSEQDIINGINWCVNNASEFNITTISMSLGLVDEFDNSILYDNYCDDEGFNLLRNAINSAVAQNISVVIASGNDGYANAIGVPACMQNAIPVSSTNKADTNISGFANTWNNSLLRILAAPGENINSTRWDPTGDNAYCSESGNYMVCSGTSMATPHVAGAITIINQYLFSIDRRKTPLEIEDLLNSTGKQIFDPSADRYFSRIDIYSALMEIDATNPGVTLSSPVNNLVDYNSNQTFSCNTSDWQLNNITLYLWNSTGLNYTETKNVSGITNVTNFSLIDLTSGNYVWNCKSSDVKGNTAFATNNFSIVIGGVSISLNYPLNNTYTRQKETTFNCSAITGQDRTIKNMTFFIYENETLANYSNVTLSGNQNSSFFNVTFFNETKYTWGCESYSNESDYMAENFTIYYDISYPAINTISEAVTTNQVTITFNTNEYTNYSILLNSIYSNSSTFSENQNLVRTGLTPYTTYQYSLTYCDRAGNCNVSLRSFTTSP
ncbi:MAG: S8 family serine peptidase, partial [archaeon]